jgi:hypothetical protein
MNASDVKTFFEATAAQWDTMRLTCYTVTLITPSIYVIVVAAVTLVDFGRRDVQPAVSCCPSLSRVLVRHVVDSVVAPAGLSSRLTAVGKRRRQSFVISARGVAKADSTVVRLRR